MFCLLSPANKRYILFFRTRAGQIRAALTPWWRICAIMVKKGIENSSSKPNQTKEPKGCLYLLGYFCCIVFYDLSFVRVDSMLFVLGWVAWTQETLKLHSQSEVTNGKSIGSLRCVKFSCSGNCPTLKYWQSIQMQGSAIFKRIKKIFQPAMRT